MPELSAVASSSTSTSGLSTSGFAPMLAPFNPLLLTASPGANNGNFVLGVRCVAGASGTLHDLTVYIGTSSGNLRVGVYDTNDALAGSRTLLYGSGSVAAGVAGYQVVADPNIAVTAGKSYDLVVFPDNNTIALGRVSQNVANMNVLPTGFMAVTGGALAKPSWAFSLAYAALPATITEANCGATGSAYWVAGRIT